MLNSQAEQLFKDESIMAVYEMLDHFSEFVNIQLSYIRRHKYFSPKQQFSFTFIISFL